MKTTIQLLAEASQIQVSLIYRNVYRLLDDMEICVEKMQKEKKKWKLDVFRLMAWEKHNMNEYTNMVMVVFVVIVEKFFGDVLINLQILIKIMSFSPESIEGRLAFLIYKFNILNQISKPTRKQLIMRSLYFTNSWKKNNLEENFLKLLMMKKNKKL